MGDDFYAAIKLISGEEIVASVSIDETNEEHVIIAHSPVVMKMLHGGAYVKIQPWMELADDDMFIFTMDKIITITEVKDKKVITIYEKFMKDDATGSLDINQLQGNIEVKPTNKMGYISTVEDARKYLEDLFKKPFNTNKES
jgi:hypothetical protein